MDQWSSLILMDRKLMI
ncbi:unnamed protein product [Pieris macdunnoughi]|uniref:Uncharacterized protein n=1 Tax=Pieris macdunnoughi TaxID=345717 RepID=A0A821W320_9NEOP|nr:unnamed protein product [Pieris macdunnoughi]